MDSVPDRATIAALWDRWNQVWHTGRYELVADCVAPVYIRHDQVGERRVSPAEYEQEIRQLRAHLPDVHFHNHDVAIVGDRLWTRWTMSATEVTTGKRVTRAGLQEYRVEHGRLAETWAILREPGSAWPEYQPHHA